MSKRMVVCSSYKGVSQQTQSGLNECMKAGWASYIQTGCADVALARNIALTTILDRVPDDPDHALLMLDDDIVFGVQDAENVCAMACETGVPVSAIYPTADGRMAAMRLVPGFDDREQMYLTGLGFLAIPGNCLHGLLSESEKTTHAAKPLIVFTWTGPASVEEKSGHKNTDMWLSEDYRMTLRLGGVLLAPIGVGHLKHVPLYPDGETLERFR